MAQESPYLNSFFELLNRSGIDYCVMNNYQGYPETIPSDIDFCVPPDVFVGLDRTVSDFAAASQLLITQKIWHGYRKCAYILTPGAISSRFRLQLDFFVDFTAKGYWKLIAHELMLSQAIAFKNFRVPSPAVEAVFLALRRVIKNDASTQKLAEIRQLTDGRDGVIDDISRLFGAPMARFVATVRAMSCAEFADRREEFRRFIRRYSHQRSTLAYRLSYRAMEIPRRASRIRWPVGYSVCLLGPDGGGKTTLIEHLARLVEGSFHGTVRLYWRPRLLPAMGRLKFWQPASEADSNPDPHGHAAQNPVKSLIRFFYYLADFILGSYLKVLPLKIRKNIVFFDRYYFDYLVDLHRYRMTIPRWLPEAFLRWVPAPDLTIVLCCPAEVMASRKQELPIDELRRQQNSYLELAGRIPRCLVVDSNAAIEQVSQTIAARILCDKAAIARRSLKAG